MEEEIKALKGQVSELERLVKHLREQSGIHATNTEKALEKHAGAMDAFHEMTASHEGLKRRVAALESVATKLNRPARILNEGAAE